MSLENSLQTRWVNLYSHKWKYFLNENVLWTLSQENEVQNLCPTFIHGVRIIFVQHPYMVYVSFLSDIHTWSTYHFCLTFMHSLCIIFVQHSYMVYVSFLSDIHIWSMYHFCPIFIHGLRIIFKKFTEQISIKQLLGFQIICHQCVYK